MDCARAVPVVSATARPASAPAPTRPRAERGRQVRPKTREVTMKHTSKEWITERQVYALSTSTRKQAAFQTARPSLPVRYPEVRRWVPKIGGCHGADLSQAPRNPGEKRPRADGRPIAPTCAHRPQGFTLRSVHAIHGYSIHCHRLGLHPRLRYRGHVSAGAGRLFVDERGGPGRRRERDATRVRFRWPGGNEPDPARWRNGQLGRLDDHGPQ